MAEETTKSTTEVPVSDISEAAANPQSFSVDGLSQTNRSISELIEADKYLRKRARGNKRRGVNIAGMISHAIPPGTCDR